MSAVIDGVIPVLYVAASTYKEKPRSITQRAYLFQALVRETLKRMETALKTPDILKVLQEKGNVIEEGSTYKRWDSEEQQLKEDKGQKPLTPQPCSRC